MTCFLRKGLFGFNKKKIKRKKIEYKSMVINHLTNVVPDIFFLSQFQIDCF